MPFSTFRPLLHALPPETAHALGIAVLRTGLAGARRGPPPPHLATRVFGLDFATPIGLAAGFDKNAAAVDPLLKLGFGFVEAGTVTPRPQPGNPRPRLFRLTEDEAIVNRLGFNNEGLAVFTQRLAGRDRRLGVTGANLGRNKDSADAASDYLLGLEAVYPHADYVTINISSPNTQGLRDLQKGDALEGLLSSLAARRAECRAAHGFQVPLLLKIAPDLAEDEPEAIVRSVLRHGLDGLIVSNTTTARPASLRSSQAKESGGLSGKPLMEPSTRLLARIHRLSDGVLPLIGVGGIASAEDAYAKIRAGASLVQFYTALVYQGFGAVRRIERGLSRLLERDGFASPDEAVGIDA